MKKIVLIDVSLNGHHIPFLEAILRSCESYERFLILPRNNHDFKVDAFYTENTQTTFKSYRKWIDEIYGILSTIKPDIIHFVFGDVFYKYFGFGLSRIRNITENIIVSFHQVKPQYIARFSERRIFKNIKFGTITNDYCLNLLKKHRINNIFTIDYPELYDFSQIKDKEYICSKYDIPTDNKIFCFVGILSKYKGIDLMLEAFESIKNENFLLIIAGKPSFYTKEYIEERISSYSSKVLLKIHYLSDEEYLSLIKISDYILTPYCDNFNGMSGPLTDAVYMKKCVISSDLRCLGNLIRDNELGYLFKTRNKNDFVKVLKEALNEEWKFKNKANEYRKKIEIEKFIDKHKQLYEMILTK